MILKTKLHARIETDHMGLLFTFYAWNEFDVNWVYGDCFDLGLVNKT